MQSSAHRVSRALNITWVLFLAVLAIVVAVSVARVG